MLQQEERENESLLPCAGITLIRFYGFYLSSKLILGTPRNLSYTRIGGEQQYKDKFFSNSCNFSIISFVLPKTLL
jgi:hypothetical protein